MSTTENITRRRFLQKAVAASAGLASIPNLIPANVLGRQNGVGANDRITLGFIGTGKMGTGLLNSFLKLGDTRVLAVCDVDQLKRNRAKELADNFYADQQNMGQYNGCTAYHDFRELLDRPDLDAVVIATPDHWHAIPAIMAASLGKDIYCEKPLSLTIFEAREMVQAARRYQRVFQTGSMQRSAQNFRFACELVRNGYIGEIQKVTVNVSGPPVECHLPGVPVPTELDWDFWLGPAPWRPFNPDIAPPITFDGWANFRAYWDYAGGGMTDWGAHHFDIGQWGLGMDGSGPVEIFPPDNGNYQVLTYKYANGTIMTREDGVNGILFTGTRGKVEVNRGYLKTWPENLVRQTIRPDEIHLYASSNHHSNWLECIRSRSLPVCDVEIGCSSATVCHLGNIAYKLKRPLKWQPEKWQFVDDAEANRLLSRSTRAPWHI